MPLLDIYTLIVAYVVGNLLVGSLMLAAFGRRLTPVLRIWIASLFVQSLGWVMMTQCGGARPLLGFAVLSVSYGLMLTALTLHFGVSRRWHWPWWPVALAFVFSLTVSESLWQRQIIGNLIAALQILLAAMVILWQTGERPALRWLMGASGLIGAAMLALRAVDVFQAGDAQCMAQVKTMSMSLMFLSFFIFRFTFMFGFILLIEGRQREAVTRLARLDSLTEAYNRRTFIELAERELGRCRRHGRSISLLIFDLDYFKRINDTHGHMAGDEVLCRVKEVVEDCLRSADLLARYGGEEFVVLMPETDPPGALRLAERLRLAIAALPMRNETAVTVSLGVAGTTKVDAACTLDGLLAEADKALYAAKAAGRNRVAGAAMMEAAAPAAP